MSQVALILYIYYIYYTYYVVQNDLFIPLKKAVCIY